MEFKTQFNSKLLLFGEYGLMYDSMALSVPFSQFSGYLDMDTKQAHLESSSEIRRFYEQLKKGESFRKLHFPFDLVRLETDLSKGLFFNSDIPQQYGVGSSGALVAALFSRYAAGFIPENELDNELLKADFVLLESYFHGRSSGVDPLISFLNRTLMIDSKKTVQLVEFDLARTGLSVSLIDTQTTGATGPLVQHFIDRFNFPEFVSAFESQFIPANNGCIESLMNGDKRAFFLFLKQLIHYELNHFSRMIPGDFRTIIEDALNEQVYIKLLGSGGGGFLLVFAESEIIRNNWAKKHGIQVLKVV